MRRIIAGIMLLVGLILILGAIGSVEFYMIWATEYFIEIGIGLGLMFLSLPVSGDISLADFKKE